jgi:hypothetical protein
MCNVQNVNQSAVNHVQDHTTYALPPLSRRDPIDRRDQPGGRQAEAFTGAGRLESDSKELAVTVHQEGIGAEPVSLEVVWRNPLALVQARLRGKEAHNPNYGWAQQAQKLRASRTS